MTLNPHIRLFIKPDDNSKIVFNKGIAKGSNASIPKGGQLAPISIAGAKLEWKKAQNIDKKAKISDTINNATPIVNPVCTSLV
jgi:hypothetical protein